MFTQGSLFIPPPPPPPPPPRPMQDRELFCLEFVLRQTVISSPAERIKVLARAIPACISLSSSSLSLSLSLSLYCRPVILSSSHPHISNSMETLDPDPRSSSPLDPLDERVLQPMKWGLVPSWRNAGQSKSHSPLLNNCRLEGMLEKPSFRSAVEKRRRCVVVADGYAGIDTTRLHTRDRKPQINPLHPCCATLK